uniref:NADH-ubiquinone oxidoreductase chain 5 n=1 Tax=Candida metapsilosis TaxID=273372 RepID=Q56E65_9ASCO|nr:NADH dehydrogenase subunit 5 [Candida metapsilosis]AAX73039.1 NADH dehydrogenase subunit 5 [Candida metapsilosis]ACB37045.1 NADH dehydrogenase subunit 5 [Candida metapsilosis]AEX57349.1 NADH dehydrogenase subunit 5 [Candida metapsilosis]AEX57364.1 NADH dehydrogenase subunit 5 [Candida metapsilosis]AEX57379.1 NADH dehydrogenase subunit 5 [Candida metapsilosis]
MFQYLYYIWEEPISISLGNWLNIGDIIIPYGLSLDSLAMTVMIPVGIVTLCVLLYAIEYMSHDPNRNTFYIILSVFAIFMTILVVSDNYIMMFIGWEFVGVISYLLISFWSTRIAAMKAALSAILLNRMGDTFFMLALGIFLSYFHAVDFDTLSLAAPYTNTLILNILSLLLLLAATAKSAQLGLHAWLLQAMEGPTPVSALLHAATMVCAGVYVLVRSYFILEYAPSLLIGICWLGGVTTLVSGLIAIVTNDIKKVIALSTMSQLSIMVLAIGISSYDLAIYHLYCHAFFKALLFMGAGSVIHSYISETQDMRKYGGLVNYLPFSYTAILIASLSLMAIPGLTGYYSKDIIIESLYGTYTFSGYILYYMAVGSATLTSLYSIRVLYLTFYNNPNSNKATYQHIHENIRMLIPMVILVIYSIFIGFNRDNVIGHYALTLPANNSFIETEFTLPWYIKLLPLILGLSLSLILVYIYEYAYKVRPSTIYNYFNNKIYYDQLLNNVIIRKTLIFGGYLNTYIDNGLLKVLGSTGISRALTYVNIGIFLNLLYLFFFYR